SGRVSLSVEKPPMLAPRNGEVTFAHGRPCDLDNGWRWADNAALDFSAPLPPEAGRHFLNVQNMLRQLFRPLQCRLILLHDRLIRPHSLPRTPQELQRLARELRGHALYVR